MRVPQAYAVRSPYAATPNNPEVSPRPTRLETRLNGMRYLRSGTQHRARKKGASMQITACPHAQTDGITPPAAPAPYMSCRVTCCERLVPMSWTIAVLM